MGPPAARDRCRYCLCCSPRTTTAAARPSSSSRHYYYSHAAAASLDARCTRFFGFAATTTPAARARACVWRRTAELRGLARIGIVIVITRR